MDEEDVEEVEEEASASYETASYPQLNSDDMIYLNEVSESVFETINFDEVSEDDRPIQHTLSFENRLLMEKFKSVVIESFTNRKVPYNFFAADIFVSLKYGLILVHLCSNIKVNTH